MCKERKNILTNQRVVILEELRKVTSHPTAYEIYDLVQKRLPRIALGTVYRNLDYLVNAGLIQQLEIKGEKKRYDGNTSPHYHIRCINCGRVDDVHMPINQELEKTAKKECNFEILGHSLEFKGICMHCKSG
ncbi:MAG: Fur family transcriptional regulator [bacterium]